MSSNHPLPPPPGQGQSQFAQQQRPRAKSSSFSFRSNHSHQSSGSGPKIDLHESHEEKQSRRLTTKADPTMAISEAEPAAVQSGERSSLASIRAIQHRDAQGNLIVDPDRSNPTRNRWERPLDTIRSFEAAIDESDGASQYNRRSSYYGGTQVTIDDRPRYSQNSYYGGGNYYGGGQRASAYRPESSYMDGRMNGMTRPESYYNNGVPEGAGPSNGYYPNRARYPRTASEPQFHGGQGVYPMPENQPPYETVTTGSGSGSSGDPAGYTTDPSSDSSVDRNHPLPKQPVEDYGIGFGNTPQYAPPGVGITSQYGSNGSERQGNSYETRGPPTLPHKEGVGPRVPIKFGGRGSGDQTSYETPRPSTGEKRKSWFGRRFSKAN